MTKVGKFGTTSFPQSSFFRPSVPRPALPRSSTMYSFPDQSTDIYIYPNLQLSWPVCALFEWFKAQLISLWNGRGMCISLCRLGNIPISMLWSVLVSSRGTEVGTIDDRGKDIVPKISSDFKSLNLIKMLRKNIYFKA